MSRSLEWTCHVCESPFSALAEYQQVYCPTCGSLLDLTSWTVDEDDDDDAADGEVEAYEDDPVDDEAEDIDAGAAPFVDDEIGLADVTTTDIRQMMAVAFEPLTWRKRTAWEWLSGVDVIGQQLERKAAASEQVRRMVKERTALMSDIKDMMATAMLVAEAQFEARTRALRMRVEALRLESERIRLEEEIRQERALSAPRLMTRQLKEADAHQQLRVKLLPPAPVDPNVEVYTAITTERKRLQARSTGRQMLVSDFLSELDRAYRARGSRTEKAMKIRAVMESYGQELDDLPRPIRDFLERVEMSHHG